MAKGRIATLWAIVRAHPIISAGLAFWTILWGFASFYDMLRGELLPTDLANRMPTIWNIGAILAATVPNWLWPLVIVVGFVFLALEFAHRRTTVVSLPASEVAPQRETPQSAEVRRDVSLVEAIDRAFLGRWEKLSRNAEGFFDLTTAEYQTLHDIAVKEVQQFAFDGDLPMWGHKNTPDVLELIPKQCWKENYVDWFGYVRGRPEELCTKIWVPGHNERQEWKNLWTSRIAVDRLWPPVKTNNAIADRSALALEVGDDDTFEIAIRHLQLRLYRREKCLGVAIRNNDRTRTIRDCKLAILDAEPYLGMRMPVVLGKGLNINPGDRALVPIALYKETLKSPSFMAGETMMIIAPTQNPSEGIAAGLDNMLTLQVTATDSPPSELQCRIWVDEHGKLRAQRMA
jgi:hypothetical protein